MDFRRGKDNELRQMAKFLAEKAKTSGIEQNIGPLNAYERRLVHLAVAEIPGVTSESIGDAAVKTVTITRGETLAISAQLSVPVASADQANTDI